MSQAGNMEFQQHYNKIINSKKIVGKDQMENMMQRLEETKLEEELLKNSSINNK